MGNSDHGTTYTPSSPPTLTTHNSFLRARAAAARSPPCPSSLRTCAGISQLFFSVHVRLIVVKVLGLVLYSQVMRPKARI